MNNNKIGERLRQARLDEEVKQNQLALILNVKPATVYSIEKGLSMPSVNYLITACAYLQTTPNDILGF